MRNLFINLALGGNIQNFSAAINIDSADKPNGSNQRTRRKRAKQALSHGGRTKGRIR